MKLIRYTSNPLTGWSPLDRLSSLRDLLDSAFQLAHWAPEGTWSPALDVTEDNDHITVSLEAAGLKREDFDLSLDEGVLTVSGERKQEEASRKGESFRSERVFGRFSRSVTLPVPVRADDIKATYQDGILTVILPKAEGAKPKKIAVS